MQEAQRDRGFSPSCVRKIPGESEWKPTCLEDPWTEDPVELIHAVTKRVGHK